MDGASVKMHNCNCNTLIERLVVSTMISTAAYLFCEGWVGVFDNA